MVRVLHIIEGLNRYGGTPNKLLLLCKYLNTLHYNVSIIYFTEEDSLISEFKEINVNCYAIKGSMFEVISKVRLFIKEEKIDIVSTHFNNANVIGTIAAIGLKKILIQHEHGLPRGFHTNGTLLKKLFIYFFDNLTCFFKSAIISNSYTVMRRVKKDIYLCKHRHFVLQNAIDTSKYFFSSSVGKLSIRRFEEGNSLVFGSIGGMIVNGIRDFITPIRAFKLLVDEGFDVKYIIAGDGDDRLRIEKEIAILGLKDHVLLIGYVDDVYEFHKMFDVFIYPITVTAGIGLSLLEAMLFSKPVISFAKGEPEECIIENNIHGFQLESMDIYNLAEKMKYFLINPKKIEDMGDSCRNLVLQEFNGNTIASRLSSIYEHLILTNNYSRAK